MRDFLLFIKYPYTAGIIAVIWLGSAAILAIHPSLEMPTIVMIDMVATVIIAGFGFRGKREI